MKKARRVDGPSRFCFCLIPFLRKTTNSWTQRRFRNFNDFDPHCTQNPSLSQPKMSLWAIVPNLTILAIAHNWKWASNISFLKISLGNFSYMHSKLYFEHDSRKLTRSNFKNLPEKNSQCCSICPWWKHSKMLDFHWFSSNFIDFACSGVVVRGHLLKMSISD